MIGKTCGAIVSSVLGLPLLMAAVSDWTARVPAAERARNNPLAGHTEAITAGRLLYGDHCAQCHADDGAGRGKRPPVRSEHVANASDGELFWLLTNGSPGHGMPAWTRLPEPERWQIVTYLRTLQPTPESRQE